MKFYQRRSVALVVLILAIIGASVYGLSKKPADLPKVEFYQWIQDDAKLLSSETEAVIEQYNTAWNDRYYAVIAVAAVDSIRGWDADEFAFALGEEWGLGSNDMLLLLVEGQDYYVALGDTLLDYMTDTQQAKLKSAIEPDYYQGDYDAAAVSFFRQADVVYAQVLQNYGGVVYEWDSSYTPATGGVNIFGVIMLLILFFLVWALLDRVRYSRYQRRRVVMPSLVYYPIFWGRSVVRPVVVRPTAPRPPQRPVSPSGGGYRSGGSTVYRSNSTARPAARPANRTAPRSGSGRGGFGNGGFGGGSRGGRSGGSRGGFGGGRR